jgi:uncharacterized membrane protein YfhO
MITFARVAMRASMMLVTLLIAVAAFLAAQTPFQHVTVALFVLMYCAIRFVGLSVIERSELVMQGVQHSPATLVRLRDERRRSRIQATVECGLLTVLGVYAAVRVVAPSLILG